MPGNINTDVELHWLELDVEKFLTTEEVAELARTAPSTVRYWRMIGKGPKGVKRGRRVLYAASGVERWLAGDEQGAA